MDVFTARSTEIERGGTVDSRVRHRAHYPTAEERAAGTDDPLAQARQILLESDLRGIGIAPGFVEHRTSAEAVAPV